MTLLAALYLAVISVGGVSAPPLADTALSRPAQTAATDAANDEGEAPLTYARIRTSMGDIDVALDREKAPITTENFLSYATSGYYDRLIFHRVVAGTLIQGGGYTVNLYTRPTKAPIVNEATNGLKNLRGTLAMARYDEPDSATSQFFINLKDNPSLDRTGDAYKKDAGYAVFGKVVHGMEIVDAMGAVKTGSATSGGVVFEQDVPVDPIVIFRIDPIDADQVGQLGIERP